MRWLHLRFSNTKRVKLQKYLRSISTYQVHKFLDAPKYSDIWCKHFLNRLFQFWKMAFDKKETLDWQFPEAKCRSLLVMIIFWCPKGTRDLRGVLNGFNSSAIGKVGSIQIVVSKLRNCGFWEIRVARVLGSTRHAEFLSGGSRQANVLLTLTLACLGPKTWNRNYS